MRGNESTMLSDHNSRDLYNSGLFMHMWLECDGKNVRYVLDYRVNLQNITPNERTKLEWQTNNYSRVRRYAHGLIKVFTTLKTKENRTE